MDYKPNRYDAIAVYMVAAQHFYSSYGNVSIDQPPSHTVEEIDSNHYRINSPKERDDQRRFTGPLAMCTYDKAAEQWTVELAPDEVPVQVVWNEDEGNWQFLIA